MLFRILPQPRLRLRRRTFVPRLAYWKLVSSYSSATVPDFHGIPRAGLPFSYLQRTVRLVTPALRRPQEKIYHSWTVLVLPSISRAARETQAQPAHLFMSYVSTD